MRPTSRALLPAVLLLAGCSQQVPLPSADAPTADTPASGPAQPVVSVPADSGHATANTIPVSDGVPQASPQERYDAALLDALNLLADRKMPQALTALKVAQEIQDTEQVQRLTARIQGLIAEEAAAQRTAQDLRGAVDEGKADVAARLASTALLQYGGTDLAPELAKVKQQAEALVTAGAGDITDRVRRLQTDARAALQDNNLRAAAISLEQALALGDDPALRQQLDEVHGRLARYDDNLRRARELRRYPTRLEEAIAALQEAARAWDTLPVRQEIDDYTLALQRRRDRVGVADFEVRGDLGVPGIGRTVAEELLSGFKARFDLVERGQVARVLDELRLGAPDLIDQAQGRQEVGRIAGVRYLVVGSLTPLAGVTAQARLVEVRSGLIVQTARVSAPTVEVLLSRLPLLAQMLLMTDEQKLAFEQAQAQQAAPVPPVAVDVPLPPPPAVDQPPPPPVVTYTARPPDFGGLALADFNTLPPVAVVPPPPPTQVVIVREAPRRRLLALSLELGDNLFRRGRYQEAHRHFQVAFSLSTDHAAIQLRLDRCRPYLPPPPPPPPPPLPPVTVVVAPPPVVVVPPPVRPRLVVFNFLVNCQPGLVPPACGDWAADNFAACFGRNYEVIERGEVCWYMGRLGLTLRDVLNDPSSRVCLAQALNARFLAFGAIEQTNSLNVTTHLIDAQTGARTGTGMIHVQDHNEMKLRMHELARQLGATPAEQTKLAQEGKESEKAVNDARKLLQAGSYTRAAAVARDGLKKSPNNTALQAVQEEAELKARQVALAEAQKREAEARKAEQAAADKRRADLARQAEIARQRAEQEAKAKGEAAHREEELRRQRAAEQLRAQGQKALREGHYTQAAQALQSAVALKPSEEASRELARARAAAEKAVQEKAAAEAHRKEMEQKAQREQAQARVDAERRLREAQEAAHRKAQEAKDAADQARLLAQAKDLLGRKQYDQAAAVLQAARQVRISEEADRLLRQAKEGQALEAAAKKGEQARAEAERRLAEEKARRAQAEAEAKRKQEAYQAALDRAQKAVAARRYNEAVTHYQEAGKLFRTDVVVNGIKQAEQMRDREKAQHEAEQRRLAAEKQRAAAEAKRRAEFARLTAQGQVAMAARRYADAVKAYGEALQLEPGEAGAMKALHEAQQALDAARTPPKPPPAPRPQPAAPTPPKLPAPPPPNPQAEYGKAMQAGATLDKQKKYADAVQAYRTALRWLPGDARATAALKNAEYEAYMAEGKKLLAARRFADAAKEFEEALKLVPTSAEAKNEWQKARAGKP